MPFNLEGFFFQPVLLFTAVFFQAVSFESLPDGSESWLLS